MKLGKGKRICGDWWEDERQVLNSKHTHPEKSRTSS